MKSLIILFIISLFFLIVNLNINSYDIMHPAVIYCLIVFLHVVICMFAQAKFAINLHTPTILVFLTTDFIFTFASVLGIGKKSGPAEKEELKEIPVSNSLFIILAVLQVIVIVLFYQYLKRIAVMFGSSTDLTEMINLYNNISKFWHVTIPFKESMVFRVLNPFCHTAAFVALYVFVNNFVATGKFNPLPIINVLLWSFQVILNGSRSPLGRMFMAAVFLFYIFHRKYRPDQFSNRRFIKKVLGWISLFAVLMLVVVNLIRIPDQTTRIGDYIFTYTGANIVNLDNYLMRSHFLFLGQSRPAFGASTFAKIYEWLAKYNIAYAINFSDLGRFNFSNGIEIGNVYTTFANFIYDFGYIGVLPLFSILALIYSFMYRKSLETSVSGKINIIVFIYAYLFFDLCMLLFSNNFYYSIVNTEFVKFLLMMVLIIICLKILGRYRFKNYI